MIKAILPQEVEVLYIEDSSSGFHRTKYLNHPTKLTETKYVAIWDADVLVPFKQIVDSVELLRENDADFVFPYDGRFLDTGIPARNKYFKIKSLEVLEYNLTGMTIPYGLAACGGGFIANTSAYHQCGLENERFVGWGLEDGERVRRWQILDYRIRRVHGIMFHFTHPRGHNSGFESVEGKRLRLIEFLRICRMSKKELENEISRWGVHQQQLT